MKRFVPAVGLSLAVLGSPVRGQEPPSPASAKPKIQRRQEATTPNAALERLREGNRRFFSNSLKHRDWSSKVVATASGQYPLAVVLGCMDSRAPIEIIFDQAIGDVFGVRVAGNVLNEDELGSLEYAVKVGAKIIVVLGHTRCGAVQGALDGVELGHLTGLLQKIQPAVTAAGCSDSASEACVNNVAEMNVREVVKQIPLKSPYLRKHLDEGRVGLVGAIYDVATGQVTFLGE